MRAFYRIVEINVAIVVACATCFPAFFAKTRIFSTSILSFLRSRIVTTTRRSDTSAHSAIGQNSTVVKKTSADSDGCYGDKAKLKDDRYFELRDTNDFGGVMVVGAAGRSDSLATDQEGVVDDQSGILRTRQYDVDSRSRM